LSGADQIKQKQSVLLAIYGQGGHRTEMERLLGHLNSRNHALAIVSLVVVKLTELWHTLSPMTFVTSTAA
jgi:hypothetical protein